MTIFGDHKDPAPAPKPQGTGIWSLFFWKRVVETDVHVFAGGMLGVLTAKGLGISGLAAVPWTAALDAGLFAVACSTLASLATQGVPNTPAGGFLPPAIPKK
jgi:hypothetical protein